MVPQYARSIVEQLLVVGDDDLIGKFSALRVVTTARVPGTREECCRGNIFVTGVSMLQILDTKCINHVVISVQNFFQNTTTVSCSNFCK